MTRLLSAIASCDTISSSDKAIRRQRSRFKERESRAVSGRRSLIAAASTGVSKPFNANPCNGA